MSRWADPVFVLVPLFVVIGVLILAGELLDTSGHAGDGVAEVPHGPGEFPEILDVDMLEGLEGDTGEYHVPRPPLNEDYWPCSDCHEADDYDPKPRELKREHQDIVLRHDEKHRWCLDCHDAEDRDHFRLASGKKIPFTQSYELCGQCHGTIFRDWRAGIHGRRTGYHDGAKRYLLCVHCHDPHRPQFQPIKPLPPPVRPEFLRPPPGGREQVEDKHE